MAGQRIKITNYVKIHKMSPEALAEFLSNLFTACPPQDCPGWEDCEKCWLKWLESEIER